MITTEAERTPAIWRYRNTFQTVNPARPPSWRWVLAGFLVEQQRRVSQRHDDDDVRSAVRFRRQLEQSKSPAALARLKAAKPGLCGACELHNRGGFQRWRLQAWLLSGLSTTAVAAKTDVPVSIVEAYEAIFFNVSDRLNATSYIDLCAIGRSATISDRTSVEAVVKGYAYYGGSLVLEVLLRDAVDDEGNLRPLDDLDLRTAAGRTAMRARLAVMVETLPFSPALISEMVRIRELIWEIERAGAPSTAVKVPAGMLEDVLGAVNGLNHRHSVAGNVDDHGPPQPESRLPSKTEVDREAA